MSETLMNFPGLNDPTRIRRFRVLYRRRFLGGFSANPASLKLEDYVVLGSIAADSYQECFGLMQGENWSPNGKANSLIRYVGTDHTSMSVGDVVVDEATGVLYYCAPCGWETIPMEP